jgi:hypothetical protein
MAFNEPGEKPVDSSPLAGQTAKSAESLSSEIHATSALPTMHSPEWAITGLQLTAQIHGCHQDICLPQQTTPFTPLALAPACGRRRRECSSIEIPRNLVVNGEKRQKAAAPC